MAAFPERDTLIFTALIGLIANQNWAKETNPPTLAALRKELRRDRRSGFRSV